MTVSIKRLALTTALTALGLSFGTMAYAAHAIPTDAEIQDAYLQGYGQVTFAINQERMTATPIEVDGVGDHGMAPLNQFSYQVSLATPLETQVIRPNADILYAEAEIDFDTGPLVLSVPDFGTRFYVLCMMDAGINVIHSVGSRATGQGAGTYLLTGPGWTGTVPAGMTQLSFPTRNIEINGRILTTADPTDLASAVASEKQITLTPLSHWGRPYSPRPQKVHAVNPQFTSQLVYNSPGFADSDYFTVMHQTMFGNPPPADQIQPYWLSVFKNAALFSAADVTAVNAAMQTEFQTGGTITNGWHMPPSDIGEYTTDYILKAAVARYGTTANAPADAIYPFALTDVNGNPLSSKNAYDIHFPAGQLPPVDGNGFWAITMYNNNGILIPNAANKYTVGSEEGLATNPDGSVDVYVQATQPTTVPISNWLPSSAVAPYGFNLFLRMYWPDQAVLNGTYQIPGVVVTAPVP